MPCRKIFVAVISLLAISTAMICTAVPSWAQAIGQVTINYIEASNLPEQFVNQVRAYVTVSSTDEMPILGLSSQDFEALEDGKPVEVEDILQADDPISVILAIDTSGSMQARDSSGQTSMDAAKNAAIDFVTMLSEEDQLAIYSFNREPVLEMDFSADKEAAVQNLNNVSAKTKAPTCLYDTAFQAVKKSAEIPMGRRAIILLTDGRDEKGSGRCSTYSVNDVIDAATTKTIRVPIYTIGVGPKVDAQELGRIARLTGGRNLMAKSISELKEFYQILANQLKNQYVVTYNSQTPSGEHSLVLKVRHEGEVGQDEKRFWLPPLPVLRPPEIRIVQPIATGEIKGGAKIQVKVDVSPPDTVAKVRYYVDAILKQEFTQPPFDVFEWDTTGLATGLHVIRVEAIDIKGQSGYAEMTRKVKGPPPPKPKPSPPVPSKPAAQAQPPKAIPIVPLILAVLIVLVIAGGASWWVIQRKKTLAEEAAAQARALAAQEEIEDETMFVPDLDNGLTAPPATITVVESMTLDSGTTFEITGRVTIGRTDRNDVNIPDKPVSRKHAELFFENNAYIIRDLGSRNGIRVDGKRVSLDVATLSDGSQIMLGPKTILQFNCASLGGPEDFDDRTRQYGA